MQKSQVDVEYAAFVSLSTHALLVLANLVPLHFQVEDGPVMGGDLGWRRCGL